MVVTVDVGIRAFRERLSYWLDRAASGDEIVVTERGKPRARVTGIDAQTTLQRLVDEGLVAPPTRPKRPIKLEELPRMRKGTLSEIVIDQRRSGY